MAIGHLILKAIKVLTCPEFSQDSLTLAPALALGAGGQSSLLYNGFPNYCHLRLPAPLPQVRITK